MKICLINNLYKPYAVGGAERVVETRALEYQKQGNEVIIITTTPWDDWKSLKPQVRVEQGIKIYRFYPLNLCWYKNLSKHNFIFKLFWHFIDILGCWNGRAIKNILRAEKIDVVEPHNLMGTGVYKVIKFIKFIKSETKTVLYLHDVQLVEPSGVLPWNHTKDTLAQKIYSWIMKRKFAEVDEVISPTELLHKFYKSRGFFQNADFRLQNAEYRNHIYSVIKNQKSEINFLFVGSLVEHKGIHVLMQAWDNVQGTTLHIVGDGILRQEVNKWAVKYPNVQVHGRLEGEALEKIYQESDVLIFPSICLENNPTVIHEALQHGLQVIASNTGGVKEIFGENENPSADVEDRLRLVEPGNVEELKTNIRQIFNKN